MHLSYPLVVVYLLITGLTGVVAWRSFRHRHVPGARWFGVGMAAIAAWALLSAMQQHPLFQGSVVYSLLLRLVWAPVGVITVAWLAFGLAYSGRAEYLTRRRVAALSALPAVTVFVGLCHPILLSQYEALLDPVGLGVLARSLEPLAPAWDMVSLAMWGYTYLLVGVGSLFLLEVLVERPLAHPGQALMLLVVVPPWLMNALYLFVLDIDSFNPTILGFAVSGVAGLFAVGRFKLFDVPLARARMVEQLDSGVLVYGRDGRVYDYNDRAASLLDAGEVVGTDVRTVLAESRLGLTLGSDVEPFADVEGAASAGPDSRSADSGSGRERDRSRRGGGPGVEPAADGGAVSLETRIDGRTVAVEGDESAVDRAAPDVDGGETEVGGDDSVHVETRVSDLTSRGGRPVSRVLHLYDVTDRERRERELQRKNELLDEFAGVVSHDIRTPLSVVQNKANLVEMTGDPDHAEDIHEATDRIEDLVDDLLALAREGQTVGDTRPVDIERVATRAWRSVDAPDARLEVADSTAIQANPQRLQQLFENLLENAVEHGSTSPPSTSSREDAVEHGSTSTRSSSTREDAVEHASSPRSPPSRDRTDPEDSDDPVDQSPLSIRVGTLHDRAGFFVEDDGPGIPLEDRETVFEQGYTTGEDNTGLGLAIVRRIADAHGWSMRVAESELGREGTGSPDSSECKREDLSGARFELVGVDTVEE